MAKVILLGNIGEDAKATTLDNGRVVINFSVAENRKAGEETHTDWYRCSLFRQNGNLASYLTKGQKVMVIGTMRIERFKSEAGNERFSVDVVVDTLEFAGGGNRSAEGVGQAPAFPGSVDPAKIQTDNGLPY